LKLYLKFELFQKNHKLLENLILDNSNEKEIVFDPCCGSGSTLLVSKKLNRKYLGFELNEEMSIKAKERF
jgi:DNA modification methylase